jgi:hypothetical protein
LIDPNQTFAAQSFGPIGLSLSLSISSFDRLEQLVRIWSMFLAIGFESSRFDLIFWEQFRTILGILFLFVDAFLQSTLKPFALLYHSFRYKLLSLKLLVGRCSNPLLFTFDTSLTGLLKLNQQERSVC